MIRNDRGQLYTLEGIAAALIMLVTVYLVLNATSVYTAGDTHIADMQLEALGSDALVMVDTAPNDTAISPLQDTIQAPLSPTGNDTFRGLFLNYLNAKGTGPLHNIQFNATYICRNISSTPPIGSYVIASTRNLSGGEHTVRATRFVLVDSLPVDCGPLGIAEDRSVLVEVLLWRD